MFRDRNKIQILLGILLIFAVQSACSWCSRGNVVLQGSIIEQEEWCKDLDGRQIHKLDDSTKSAVHYLESHPFDSVQYVIIKYDHRSTGELLETWAWFSAGVVISGTFWAFGGMNNPLVWLDYRDH
jgi:hypothetical protein